MKVEYTKEYGKKDKQLKFIPQCDMDVWQLADVFGKVKLGGMSVIGGKIHYVTMNPLDMLNAIQRLKEQRI